MLPIDSQARKEIPLHRGLFKYFPAALAGVAQISYSGNAKHNKEEHAAGIITHTRGKSNDHGDCILRHLMDIDRLIAKTERDGHFLAQTPKYPQLLEEVSNLCWRALALAQEVHEKYGDAELAPGATVPKIEPTVVYDPTAFNPGDLQKLIDSGPGGVIVAPASWPTFPQMGKIFCQQPAGPAPCPQCGLASGHEHDCGFYGA